MLCVHTYGGMGGGSEGGMSCGVWGLSEVCRVYVRMEGWGVGVREVCCVYIRMEGCGGVGGYVVCTPFTD